MKSVHVSAYIENLDEYPDYVFMVVETLGDEVRRKEVVQPGQSISPGYKLNQVELFALPKETFDAHGDTEEINPPDVAGSLRSGPLRVGRPELVSRTSPLTGRDDFYRVLVAHDTVSLELVGQETFMEEDDGLSVSQFFPAFVITFAIELIVFILLVRIGFRLREPGTGRLVVAVLIAQAATLPLIWLGLHFFGLVGLAVMLGAEAFAIVTESVVYRIVVGFPWKRAILAAFVCNLMSWLAGFLV